MNFHRLSLLTVAIVLIVIGTCFALQNVESTSKYAGIFVRVGLMLFVLWIAYPQLDSLRSRSSIITWIVIFVVIGVAAARPRIFPVAAGLALAALFVNGLLRRLAGTNPSNNKQRLTKNRPTKK